MGDAVYGDMQLVYGMHGEIYQALYYIVFSVGCEAAHGQVLTLHEAVYDITQQMIAVYGNDADTHRILSCRIGLEVCRYDCIAILRCQFYGVRAMTAVNGNHTFCVLKTNDLVSGARAAVGAEMEIGSGHIAQGVTQVPAGLVCLCELKPFRLGNNVF